MKKFAVMLISLFMVFSLTGCMPSNQNNATASVDLVLPTIAGEESGQEVLDIPEISDADYDDNIDGLCQYLTDAYAVAGDKTQMSYDVIGAADGYRYLFRYNKSSVQVEVYAFDIKQLSEEAEQNLESVKANGMLKVIDREIRAVISDSGKYVMIYQDSSAEEANQTQRERVIQLFQAFHS